MEVKDTYYIKRNDIYIWSGTDFEILQDDELIEVRPMLFAGDGKLLVKDDIEIGQAVWLKNGDSQDNYIEVDEPIEPEEVEVQSDVVEEVIL